VEDLEILIIGVLFLILILTFDVPGEGVRVLEHIDEPLQG
jgi:hypothetical protein